MTKDNLSAFKYVAFNAAQIKILLTALIGHIDILMCQDQLTVKERITGSIAAWQIAKDLIDASRWLQDNKPEQNNGGSKSHNTHCET